MKALNFRKILVGLSVAIVFSSCTKDPEVNPNENNSIVPEKFTVEIPESVISEAKNLENDESSAQNIRSEEVLLKVGTGDNSFQSRVIYAHLGMFIGVGKAGAELTQSIMTAIKVHHIENVVTLTYKSDDDGRDKNLVVTTNSEFNGVMYEYQLSITDALNEANDDGGLAMQVFWSNAPVEGVAILYPKNINVNEIGAWSQAMFQIEYMENNPLTEYEAEMTVSISGLPVPNAISNDDDKFAMKAMKMFVGKKGNLIDIYGNSTHPNAQFISENVGFSYTFVASADNALNIASAEVGLPSLEIDSDNRAILLDDNSVYNILEPEVVALLNAHPELDSLTKKYIYDLALQDAVPPAYFNADGFVSAGTLPNESYTEVAGRIKNLTPYSPKAVAELQVLFKQ